MVSFSRLPFLTITDEGAPDGPVFAGSVEGLYKLAYSVKSIYKSEAKDFAVAKLEGLRIAP